MFKREDETTVEGTPTWVVALVSLVIVMISLAVERIIHYIGKYLKKKQRIPLYEALLKIKAELMLLGFISLLLTVAQDQIGKWCIPRHLANNWLPCQKDKQRISTSSVTTFNFCAKRKKVPLLSVTAVHHLHIFIFVLAVVHVTICALTVLFGGLKLRQWKPWEDAIQKKMEQDPESDTKHKLILVQQHSFVRHRFLGIECALVGWIHAFFKQFYGSVSETEYKTLRMGFILTHCKTSPKFNFHRYMERAFQSDFKKVVGISWYLWLFVVVILLLNIAGFHTYFWIAFIPFILLLAVGMKLEHVITQLAEEVASTHSVVEDEIEIKPSDQHFWFHRPRIVLLLVHIILFQNSFEIAFLLWIGIQYGFHSCIMGETTYTIPRIIIAVFIQFICSYSTLPLYAIVTQMRSNFNKAIFEDNIREGLVDWAHHAKKKVKCMHRCDSFLPCMNPCSFATK